MKINYLFLIPVALMLTIFTVSAQGPVVKLDTSSASNFHLVEDINALAESNPRNVSNYYLDIEYNIRNRSVSYAVLANVVYFIADDGIHGSELWRSDGTNAGTYLVKDITPGAASSPIFNINSVNGKIYFTADIPTTGYEPWVSDGTATGTQLLKDISAGVGSSAPAQFFAMGNETYFIADGNNVKCTVWKTDGTTAGTNKVIDLGYQVRGEQIAQPTPVNGLLFFTCFDYETEKFNVWRSDFTDTGTYHVGDMYPSIFAPAQLTGYNNRLYFSASDGTSIRKLWVSDGTNAGTMPAPGNHGVLIDADYLGTSFTIRNNVLYIPAREGPKVHGLYKYDASDEAGLVRIKYFASVVDTAFIVPSEMLLVNNMIYFKVVSYNGGIHDEIWSSKGTQTSTHLVQKYPPGETVRGLSGANGICYFIKYDKTFGTELWRIAEASAGPFVKRVSDIFKGRASGDPACLTAFRGKLIFSAVDEKKGAELFITNGDSLSNLLVKDINTSSTSGADVAVSKLSYAGFVGNINMATLGNEVLFNAYERVHGNELYKSNGTAAGTTLLNELIPGEKGYTFRAFSTKNNAVYFIATNDSTIYAIYKTTGTKNSLRKMTPEYGYYMQSYSVADNGLVFYVLTNGKTNNYELWRTDGSAAGTILLSSTLYRNNFLNVIGNTALFVARDSEHGFELWESDGSIAGTGLVKEIIPGISGPVPEGMFIYKNKAYFSAYDTNAFLPSLWRSDGTKNGTIKVKNVYPVTALPTAFNSSRLFCVSNNILYFTGTTPGNPEGTKLWKTDGTTNGTKPIRDIDTTVTSSIESDPDHLTDVNGTLFFTAGDGLHGRELWKSDGHANGTKLVKDITPGGTASQIDNLTAFEGKLYFRNAVNGRYYLWTSDGTPAGTHQVEDSGIVNVEIVAILAAGKNLFISGNTYKYGTELYAGKVDEVSGKLIMAGATNDNIILSNLPFNAALYPNPVLSNATLQITGNTKNATISITNLSGVKLWHSNTRAGLVKLPIEKFAAGTYLVTVITILGNKTLTLIKK